MKMRASVLLIPLLFGNIFAFADEPNPSLIQPIQETEPSERMLDDTNGYWQQFGFEHVTETSVFALLSMQSGTSLLWSGTLKGSEWVVSWNAATQEVEIAINNSALTDVQMNTDLYSRPAFDAAFQLDENNNMVPVISGYIDYDEANSIPLIRMSVGGTDVRIIGHPAGSCLAQAVAVIGRTSCGCFGGAGGTTTRTCTDPDCDEGISCGTDGNGNNKACRWSAAEAL